MPTAWKYDIDIYDRPGWHSYTYSFPGGGGIRKRLNGEIVIRFDSADGSGINDDFYVEHYRQVVLSSMDNGLTWEEIEPYWQYHMPVELSDGTLLDIVDERSMETAEDARARMKERGLKHLWHDDCLLAWDLWPVEMADELRQQGLIMWDTVQGDCADRKFLPDGTVAVLSASDFFVRKSTDNGNTWKQSILEGPDISSFGHLAPCFAGSAVLPDDTVLVPFYGVERKSISTGRFDDDFQPAVFIMRSADKGEIWQRIDIDSSAGAGFNESCVVAHPSGRAIILIRTGDEGGIIYRAVSDDGGLTWTKPERTPMKGMPINAICLQSGNILCTYTHRWHPAGIYACLSCDAGETWDIENEKLLRNAYIPSTYIGGPGSVQLEDGTIFTMYSIVRIENPKPEDRLVEEQQLVMNPRYHCFVAGSRYTEDYVRVLGS